MCAILDSSVGPSPRVGYICACNQVGGVAQDESLALEDGSLGYHCEMVLASLID